MTHVRDQAFISYSHGDNLWLDRIRVHLAPLVHCTSDLIWVDSMIEPGERWPDAIHAALERAKVAVLLVSPDFLNSWFIMENELPSILHAAENDGLAVLWVAVRHSAYSDTEIADFQPVNNPTRPLATLPDAEVDRELVGIARRIKEAMEKPVRFAGASPAKRKRTANAKESVYVVTLPYTSPHIVNRDDIVSTLNEIWKSVSDATGENAKLARIVALDGEGGVGKSAIVNKWLSESEWTDGPRPQYVIGWSFYNQGRDERLEVSADAFFDAALSGLQEDATKFVNVFQKAQRLLEIIRSERTVLILDGLEPLQYGSSPWVGRIRDLALDGFLSEFATQCSGLCIVTSRQPLELTLAGFDVTPIKVEHLSPDDAVELLRAAGIRGSQQDLMDAAIAFDGHPLSLTLLATWLRSARRGDARNWAASSPPGLRITHLKTGNIIAEYEKRWARGPEIQILRLLAFFNCPTPADLLRVLSNGPPIDGLTDRLVHVSKGQWRAAVLRLRRARLLYEADPMDPDTLDTHPLVRRFFADQLRGTSAWREGHNRLFEYLSPHRGHASTSGGSRKKHRPSLLDKLSLFRAVYHGCQAGVFRSAFDVYWRQILEVNDSRRVGTSMHTRHTGESFPLYLDCLSGFFCEGWDSIAPSPIAEEKLSYEQETRLKEEAGHYLFLMGRLEDAKDLLEAAVVECVDNIGRHVEPDAKKLHDYTQNEIYCASKHARLLRELYLIRGEIYKAEELARESKEFARELDDPRDRVSEIAGLAQVLHYLGRDREADDLFGAAEQIQVDCDRTNLVSFSGYWYCERLLDRTVDITLPKDAAEKLDDVFIRARLLVRYARDKGWLVDEGHGNMIAALALARACLHNWKLTRQDKSFKLKWADPEKVLKRLKRGINCLKGAGQQHHLASGYLASAEAVILLRESGCDLKELQGRAAADLQRVKRICDACRGADTRGMELFDVERRILHARLSLLENEKYSPAFNVARQDLLDVFTLIEEEEMGYRRRPREIQKLAAAYDLTREYLSILTGGVRSSKNCPSFNRQEDEMNASNRFPGKSEMETLAGQYPGQWVAFLGAKFIASDPNRDVLYKLCADLGYRNFSVVRLPATGEQTKDDRDDSRGAESYFPLVRPQAPLIAARVNYLGPLKPRPVKNLVETK